MISSAKQRAKFAVCASNLRQLGSAYTLYATDHEDFVPPYTNWEIYLESYEPESGKAPTSSKHPQLLYEAVSGYGVKSVTYCPDDAYRGTDAYKFDIRHRYWSYWFRPFRAEITPGQRWPIRFNLSSDTPMANRIIQDAAGLGRFDGHAQVLSAHPDFSVNALAPDLSVRHIPFSSNPGE